MHASAPLLRPPADPPAVKRGKRKMLPPPVGVKSRLAAFGLTVLSCHSVVLFSPTTLTNCSRRMSPALLGVAPALWCGFPRLRFLDGGWRDKRWSRWGRANLQSFSLQLRMSRVVNGSKSAETRERSWVEPGTDTHQQLPVGVCLAACASCLSAGGVISTSSAFLIEALQHSLLFKIFVCMRERARMSLRQLFTRFHGKMFVLDQLRLCVTSRRMVGFGGFDVLIQMDKRAKIKHQETCLKTAFPRPV